jgi:hypothetical protein
MLVLPLYVAIIDILATAAFAQTPIIPVPWPQPPEPIPTVAPRPATQMIMAHPSASTRLVPPSSGDPASLTQAIAALQAALRQEVPQLLTIPPQRQQRILELAQAQLRASDTAFIERPQIMLVVDRNPSAQQIWLVLARADAPWLLLGGTRVSTGTTGRFDHYITPTGAFQNTADILGYRAEGTYNENHIRGNGVKGMRVWDFGWQWAEKGWRADRERGQIRLEMHATDPDTLVHQIGHTASSGCIRIPDALNRFLDRHGVIDADYERAAIEDIRFRALLLPDRIPTPLAGNTVIIVDSAERG